jgi:HK97 family phage portal protein
VVGRIRNAYRALTAERAGSLSDLEGLGYVRRGPSGSTPSVTQETALRNSVWWAGLHLKANVFSSFPLDVVKPGPDGLTYAVANPGPLVEEPYPGCDITEWMYSTEMDLSRYGNSAGIIRLRNANGKPVIVEPAPMAATTVIMNGRQIKQWKIDGIYYDPSDIWHEKRHTVSGFALGLSPLAYAAWSLGLYASAQQFALDWFATGANPKGTLKNTDRPTIPPAERKAVQDEFRASTAGGDIFVHGQTWEWTAAQQDSIGAGFLAQQTSTNQDVCRFVGVPASMVGVETATGNITYANVSQANLSWLIQEIGPSARRTERYWSKNAFPSPWQLKLNTDALLRMDPTTKADLMVKLKTAGLRVPSELRALDNLPPYTADQLAELDQHAGMSGKATGGKGSSGDAPAPTSADAAKAQAEILQKAYLAVGVVITADEARALANQAGGDLPIPSGPLKSEPAPAVPQF